MALHRSVGNQAIGAILNPPQISDLQNGGTTLSGSGGKPIESRLRAEMESRFQRDFSGVRIHANQEAADSAKAIRAKAYTIGGDIMFAENRFVPGTSEGKRLLAHELAHVVQQSRGGVAPALSESASHELDADRASSAFSTGNSAIHVAAATGIGLARAKDEDDGDDSGESIESIDPKDPRYKAAKERAHEIASLFGERAHDEDESAELAHERLRVRTERSEVARHGSGKKKATKEIKKKNTQGHHAYPKFLGGNRLQTLMPLSKELHYVYHEELYDLLEKEFKTRGKLPKEAGRASRRHYGRIFSRLSEEEKKEVLDRIIRHAEAFDDKHQKAKYSVKEMEYPDKRKKLAVALRRGIKEAEQTRKEQQAKKAARAAKPTTAATGATTVAPMKTLPAPPTPKPSSRKKPARGTASAAVATPGKLSPQMRASVPSKKAPQALPPLKPPATHQTQHAPAKPVTATQASTTPAVTPVSPPPTQVTPANKPTATGGSTSRKVPDTKVPTSPKSQAAPVVPVALPRQDPSAPSTGQQTKPPSTPKTQTPPTAPTKDPGQKKSTLEAHKGASVTMGTNERGVAATAGASTTQSHGRGVSTSQSVDASGKIHAKIEEIPNTSPQRYRVTVSIDLSAGAQVGAEREGRVGGTLSAGASGSLTMSRSHEMSPEQKDAYIKALNTGSGGATDELRVAQMVESGHISEAREFLKRMKSKGFSAEDAKHMAEGDEETISVEGSVDAKAGMSGSKSGGGTKLGAEFGISKSGQLVRTRALRGGKVYLTIAVRAASTTTLGGSFSEGVAGMGLTHEAGESRGKSVTFVLDPNNPNFDAQYKEVMAADTVDDLGKLASSKPELAGATTTSHGKSSGLTTTASVGIFGASVNEGGEYGEEETKDEQGVTHRYTGTGTLGGSLSVAGKTVHSSSTADRFTGEVGPDKKGGGETSSTHTETDYGASAGKLAKSLKSDAVGTIGGLLTGHTEVLQSKTEVQGKKLTDDSYTRLAELSKDAKSWQQSWHGRVADFVDWEKTRHKVLAANGDRDRIAKALAEFESEGSGRSKTVENAVSDTGIAFDFPDALADQKPVYEELVAANPTDHPRELAEAGKQTEALGEIAADQEKLGHLQEAIRSHQAEITPAALSEMLRRVSARRAELRAEKRELSPAPVAQTKDAPRAGSAAQAPAEKNPNAEAAVKREEAQAKAESIFSDMRANKSREQGNFSEIQKELEKEKSWFSKPDVIRIAYLLNDLKPMYEQWEKSIGDLRNVLKDAGQSPDLANQYGPDRARWKSIHDKVFTW